MCTIQHLCWCQPNARECIQTCVQWSRHIHTSQEYHWSYSAYKTLCRPLWQVYFGHKQPVEVDFYIAKDDGSVFLSHEAVFQLHFLDVKPRLECLPPRVTLISSATDYLRKEVHAQSRSHKTTTQHRGCPFWINISQFWIHISQFWIQNCTKWTHNATRRHSKEDQDCQS